MRVVAVVGALTGELVAAIGVRDGDDSRLSGRGVHGGTEVVHVGRTGLDEHDLAARADRGGHVEVKRDLLSPAGIGGRRRGAAGLVDLAEAAARLGARAEAELRPV